MPAPVLSDLVAPERTAIVTQECQEAIVGRNAGLRDLAVEAQREAVPNIARLLDAGRAAGVKVVHCTIERRADGLGSNTNARIFSFGRSSNPDLTAGSPATAILPELGPAPGDVVLRRYHGMGPMTGTDLDIVLRNMGITTIVGVGVSVNIAITNFVMDAVNRAYAFVLPRDAVAGIPREYAEAVIDNTLSLLTTLTTTDALIDTWSGGR